MLTLFLCICFSLYIGSASAAPSADLNNDAQIFHFNYEISPSEIVPAAYDPIIVKLDVTVVQTNIPNADIKKLIGELVRTYAEEYSPVDKVTNFRKKLQELVPQSGVRYSVTLNYSWSQISLEFKYVRLTIKGTLNGKAVDDSLLGFGYDKDDSLSHEYGNHASTF